MKRQIVHSVAVRCVRRWFYSTKTIRMQAPRNLRRMNSTKRNEHSQWIDTAETLPTNAVS